MSAISKTTFTFVVLHRTDEPFLDIDADTPYGGTLGDAMQRSWDGNAVGAVVTEDSVEITDTDVEDQLLQLGNDGTFFDSDLGLEEDLRIIRKFNDDEEN